MRSSTTGTSVSNDFHLMRRRGALTRHRQSALADHRVLWVLTHVPNELGRGPTWKPSRNRVAVVLTKPEQQPMTPTKLSAFREYFQVTNHHRSYRISLMSAEAALQGTCILNSKRGKAAKALENLKCVRLGRTLLAHLLTGSGRSFSNADPEA